MTDDARGSSPSPAGEPSGPTEWTLPQSWDLPPDWALPDVHNPEAPGVVPGFPDVRNLGAPGIVPARPRRLAGPLFDTGSDAWCTAQVAVVPPSPTATERPDVPVLPEVTAMVSRSERRRLLTAEQESTRSPVQAVVGVLVAVAGVAVVLVALLAVRGGATGDSPAVVAAAGKDVAGPPFLLSTASPAVSGQPQESPASAGPIPAGSAPADPAPDDLTQTAPPSGAPVAGPASAAPAAREPLTVLNGSRVSGLADRAAADYRAGGWSVVIVDNYTGQVPSTTVYYAPGQEPVARRLAAQFVGIVRVLPRFTGLPGSGLTVILTRDYQA